MSRCDHENFAATVDVNRLTTGETAIAMSDAEDRAYVEHIQGPVRGFSADVRIRCADCGTPFKFLGVPGGLLGDRPACSADGTELRAPITPTPFEGGSDGNS